MAEENEKQIRNPEGPLTTVGKFVLGEDAFDGEIPFTSGVKYGDEKGSLIINPLKTDKLLNFKEYFEKHDFEEQDFDLGDGNKIEGVKVRSYALPNGDRIRIGENDNYETIMSDFNQVNPSTLFFEDKNGNIIESLDVNKEINTILRENIKARIKREQKGVPTGLGFRYSFKPKLPPNLLTGVKNPFDFSLYYKKDETGELLPTLDKSVGREAQNFLDYVDEQMPNLKATTLAKLINRNIYGRTNLTFKPFDKDADPKLTIDPTGLKTTGEKFYYQITDLPRAYADFALLVFGGIGELGYRGLDSALSVLPFEEVDAQLSTDKTAVLPQPAGPFSSQGRETIMSYLGPDAVERYRQALAQDNILVSKDQARKLLNYTRDTAESGQLLIPSLLLEVAAVAKIMKKLPFFGSQEDEFKKLKQYEINNPNIKPEHLLDSYLKDNPVIGKSFRNYFRKNKIKEGSQIFESALPLEQRSLVVDATNTVKVAKENLRKEVLKQKELRAVAKKEFPNASLLKQDTDEVIRARAKVTESLMRKRLAERNSGTPQYIRESFRDTAVFATIASVAGQTFQEMGYDKDLGMLLGFGGVLGYSFLNNKMDSAPLAQRYLNTTNDQPLDVFKYVSSGELGQFKSKGELYDALLNPDLVRLSKGTKQDKKNYKMAVKLQSILTGMKPEVADQIVTNIQYYNSLKKGLMDIGVSKDVLDKSFANLSGMGFLDALEDSFVYSINQNKVIDADTSAILKGFEDRRSQMNQELSNALKNVLRLPKEVKENPIIINFVDQLNTGIEYSKDQLGALQGIRQNYINAKAVILKNLMSGVPDDGTQVYLQSMTGITNPTDLMKELFDDLVKEKVIDFNAAIALAPKIDQTRDKLVEELVYGLNSYDQRFFNEAGKISPLKQTKTVKGQKPIVTIEELGQYNNENASLGKAFMVNFHNAKSKASVPFKAFDAKYRDSYGTDATELGLKILDNVREGAGDKAVKRLMGQTMKNSDMSDIFTIFNDAAKDTLLRVSKELDSPNFRQNYVEKIVEEYNFKGTITDLDIFGYIRDTDDALFQSLGFALNMTDTQRLRSALGARATAFNNAGDVNKASVYSQYFKDADGLYDKIIGADGMPVSDQLKIQIQSEISEARTFAKTFFYDRFINEGSRLRKWAMPKSVNLDNADQPGGNKWSAENEPSTWFNLSKIKDDDIQLKNSELRSIFATDVGGQGDYLNYVVDPNSQNAKFLQQLSNIKFKKQVAKLAKNVSDPAKFYEEVLNLRTRTEQLFRYNPFNKSQTAFNYDEAMDQLTDLPRRYTTDKQVQKIIDDEFQKNFNPKLLTEGNKINTVMRKMDDNIRTLTRLSDGGNERSFFENFVLDADGLNKLNLAKDSVVKSGAMDATTFNEVVKEIVARHIAKSTMRPTGKVLVTKDLRKTKEGKNIIDRIQEQSLDVEGLITILDNDTAMSNLISGKILSEDQIKNIRTIVEFVKRDQRPQGAGGLSFTGDPRGLSIESYISRFYSISRGVVSPRYVFTEAMIQNIRMKDHRMLQEMLTNPEVGSILADMLQEGKRFTEAKEIRLKELMVAMAINANVAYSRRVEAEMKSGQKQPFIDMTKLY